MWFDVDLCVKLAQAPADRDHISETLDYDFVREVIAREVGVSTTSRRKPCATPSPRPCCNKLACTLRAVAAQARHLPRQRIHRRGAGMHQALVKP